MRARALSAFFQCFPARAGQTSCVRPHLLAGVCGAEGPGIATPLARPLKRGSAHMYDNDIDLDSLSTAEHGYTVLDEG